MKPIAADLAGMITTIVKTGDLPLRQELCKKVPPGLRQLMTIPGCGPKRAMILHKKLKVNSIVCFVATGAWLAGLKKRCIAGWDSLGFHPNCGKPATKLNSLEMESCLDCWDLKTFVPTCTCTPLPRMAAPRLKK
jgi:hypothetical protein